jgi:hypothetical protein
MFPTQTNTITPSTNKITLNFDFETGEFVIKDGKIEELSGLEGLKIWIKKILETEKNRFKIYDTDDIVTYGISLLDIITSGNPIAYIESELTKEITEILLINSDILSVSNFIFSRDIKRTLTVKFTVGTTYGVTTSEVII